jgi:hypothetical protein
MSIYPEPEWNAVNINRKRGDTTFSQCGWCKHADSGSARYQCMIETYCSLMPRYSNEVYWDTPCKIMKQGKQDLKSTLLRKASEIESYKKTIGHLKDEMSELNDLIKKAHNSPPTSRQQRPRPFRNQRPRSGFL